MPGLVRKRAPQLHRKTSAGRWVCSELLAESQWTQTFAARPTNHSGGEHFAIKLLRNDLQTSRERQLAAGLLRREAEVGRAVAHRHLTTTLGVEPGIAGDLILIQPLLPGTQLPKLSSPRSLAVQLWTARQTAEALAALHQAGWLHGDVTPESIWVGPQGHVSLGELGWSRQLQSDECDVAQTQFAGNLRYAAPETFDSGGRLTAAADVYSLGAVLFELLNGRPIFAEFAGPQLVAARRMLPPPRCPAAPYAVALLVARLLSRDPLRRPTAREAIDMLISLEIEHLSDTTKRPA
jgi:serine/threonine protein kinase